MDKKEDITKNDQKIDDINPKRIKVDTELDKSLRPRFISEFIGQDKIIENLLVFIKSAKKRKEPLDHVILSGPPGLGKTCLAEVIANELGVGFKITSGPAIERAGDLAAILTNLENFDVLFVDEIHRLSRGVEEILYPAMEDYKLDIIIGKGPSAKSIRIDIAPFTIIGATTRIGLVASPLRERFGVNLRLDYYNEKSIIKIIKRSAGIFGIDITDKGAKVIAGRSRGTPRIANRLLRRVRDYAMMYSNNLIDDQIAENALGRLDIDKLGLDVVDKKILNTLVLKFEGGPVGIGTLAASIGEEADTIEDVYEPYLLQLGFVKRTSKGRVATKLAYEYMGINKESNPKLFK
jgi:Holliday junction DNA helicase RuvB